MNKTRRDHYHAGNNEPCDLNGRRGLLPDRAPTSDAAVSAGKSARRLIAGKMSGPGAADAVGGSGAFRRTVRTYFTPGIGLAEMPVGDRERRVDDNFAYLLANDYFGPRAIKRVGARRRGERCDSISGQQADCQDKSFHETPLRFLFAGSTAAASDLL